MKFRIFVASLWVASIACFFPACDRAMRDQQPVRIEAKLIEAYPTLEGCGSKGRDSCQVFKGRFYYDEYKLVFDQDINIFDFKRFESHGAYMAERDVSWRQIHGQDSAWWSALGAFIFLIIMAIPVGALIYCVENSGDDGNGSGAGGSTDMFAHHIFGIIGK